MAFKRVPTVRKTRHAGDRCGSVREGMEFRIAGGKLGEREAVASNYKQLAPFYLP